MQNAASNLESVLQIAQLVVDDCDDPELGSQPAMVLHQVVSEGRKMSFGLAVAGEEFQRLSAADFPKPTSAQLPEPASGVGRCSTADESHAEPHARIKAGLLVTRPLAQQNDPGDAGSGLD